MFNGPNYKVIKISEEGKISTDTNTSYSFEKRRQEIVNFRESELNCEKAGKDFAKFARDLILNIKFLKLNHEQKEIFFKEIEMSFEEAWTQDTKNSELYHNELVTFQHYYHNINLIKNYNEELNVKHLHYAVMDISEQGSISIDLQIPDYLDKKLEEIATVRQNLLTRADSIELMDEANAIAGSEYAKLAHVLLNNINYLKLEMEQLKELHSSIRICFENAMILDSENTNEHLQNLQNLPAITSYYIPIDTPLPLSDLVNKNVDQCNSAEDYSKFALKLSYADPRLALCVIDQGLQIFQFDAKLLEKQKIYKAQTLCYLAYTVAKQELFWNTRYSPTEMNEIKRIYSQDPLVVNWLTKWEQISKLANPKSWFAFMRKKERHQDTEDFLKYIKDANPNFMEGFLHDIKLKRVNNPILNISSKK